MVTFCRLWSETTQIWAEMRSFRALVITDGPLNSVDLSHGVRESGEEFRSVDRP